ncbi:MAG: 5-oxoprolinase subunit PxpA [Rhizobiales bacterium]|nr:5-oxoprolinase subunit PxpA [Hyphomicrobiales bacterium]
MSDRININADMAEGFGAYDIGDDDALLDIVRTANVACGFHGGDAATMRRVAIAAAAKGVSIGAHPGFDDLWGFGRRQIRMNADELEYQCAYQIGAMQAMAHYAGIAVTHVKAHGALNNMACTDRGYAMAIARAVKVVDAGLIHLVMPGTELERVSRELGLVTALEAFVDRTYEDDGTLTPRSMAGSVIRDEAVASARAVRMVTTGEIVARSGKVLRLPFHSLCVHGDEPTAVAVARAVRRGLEAAGVSVVTLPEMLVDGAA